MRFLILYLLFLLPDGSYAQQGCYLKLIDAYSLQPIKADTSFRINRKFTIDGTGNLLSISQLRGRKLRITVPGYVQFGQKIPLKRYRDDTLTLQLLPNDSLVSLRFREIWEHPASPTDTLEFATANEVQRQVLSYLNYLRALGGACDNGMCNYSNTYRYDCVFVSTGAVFHLEKVVKQQPREYACDELDTYLQQFPGMFPPFRLRGKDGGELRLSFVVML